MLTCSKCGSHFGGTTNGRGEREILELFITEIKVTVEKTNSPYAPKILDIDGAIKLHSETSIVGEVTQTYFKVNLGKEPLLRQHSFEN